MRPRERFEDFYFAKVGMGEACGCAERIIDVYEFNRRGGRTEPVNLPAKRRRNSLRSLAYKYGLLSRRRPG